MKIILKGVTLIELLIVIALLGFLFLFSALIAPATIRKARDAKRKTDLERIKTALYDYYFDTNCFPKTLPNCGEDFSSDSMVHLGNFPCDPKGNIYGYQVEESECSGWFKALTNLENTLDPSINEVGCRHGCGPYCEYNYGVASTNIRVNKDCVAYYACTPGSKCAEFEDPFISQCPQIFENDPTCANACDKRENRCHDDRGKKVPEE